MVRQDQGTLLQAEAAMKLWLQQKKTSCEFRCCPSYCLTERIDDTGTHYEEEQVCKSLYLNKIPCLLHLFFHYRASPETPHLALGPHLLLTLHVWSGLVYNEVHFSRRSKYLVGRISSPVEGFFVKHHIWCFATVSYNVCKFDSDRFIMKGRVKTVCDGTRAETRFGLPVKRTSPIISAGVSVQSSTGFLAVRVEGERLQ